MLGKDQELALNISVSNEQESAYETQLFVSHPASIGYIGRKVEVCNLKFQYFCYDNLDFT